MKVKTKKTIAKRFTISHPKKKSEAKVMFDSPGFKQKSRKRKMQLWRSKLGKVMSNGEQAKKIIKVLS